MAEDKFFSFRSMISPQLIKVVYALGMIALFVAGLLLIIAPFLNAQAQMALFGVPQYDPVRGLIAGLLVLVGGNLMWRIACETWILLFSVHELLSAINDKLSREP